MSGQHTPGPWRYWACRVDSSLQPPMYDYAQFANLKHHVFRAPLRYLKEADARLIAAAPELLEALKVLADEANGFSISGVYFNEKCMGHKGLDMAFAAIAKVTGEQP